MVVAGQVQRKFPEGKVKGPEMADIRSEIHNELDRVAEGELLEPRTFLATLPDRLGAFLRNAPLDDEQETEEEMLAVAEAQDSIRLNGGKCIPHEQVMRGLGLE